MEIRCHPFNWGVKSGRNSNYIRHVSSPVRCWVLPPNFIFRAPPHNQQKDDCHSWLCLCLNFGRTKFKSHGPPYFLHSSSFLCLQSSLSSAVNLHLSSAETRDSSSRSQHHPGPSCPLRAQSHLTSYLTSTCSSKESLYFFSQTAKSPFTEMLS